jgi:hypothetical protein
MMEDIMVKSVDVEEDLKRKLTREEIDEAVADLRRINAEFDKANLEYPLPDDFIEYVKGRKTLLTADD